MAVYCMNCGTELPDEANFCWKCGAAQRETTEDPDLAAYEICEVTYGTIKAGKYVFWAEAIGPKGRYSAGESVPYKDGFSWWDGPWTATGEPVHRPKDSEKNHRALDELIVKLT